MDRMQGHAITAAYAAALAGVAFKVNAIVKDPYMDEIFHVPQAQRYCKGDFWTWDPMITTPPGLYLTSSSFAMVAQWIKQDLCTTAILRATNIAFSAGILAVIAKLLHVLHPGTDKTTINLYALTLACFPVSMFYTFVYYTDSGSTFFVLLSYLLSKQRKYMLSGLVALISLSFRQTNIIWLVFTMGNSMIDLLSAESKKAESTALVNPIAAEISSLGQCLQSISSLLTNAVFNLHKLIPQLAAYIFSICSFIAFLYWNKGIVLGDHSAHVAGLHFPQLFYFIAFLTFFTLPLTINTERVRYLLKKLQNISLHSIITSAGACLAMLALIHKFTYEHPYLLADNRHYSFYLWRKVYKRHWTVRYLLSPVYMACGWFCYIVAAPSISFLFLLAYITAVSLTLVPSPLLEFRYFIIPFYIFLVHIKVPKVGQIMVTTAFYLAINGWTIWMFLHKGFIWDSEIGRVQRFIW